MAQAQGSACFLDNVNNMGVVHTDSASGGGSIEYDGELSEFSSGIEASVLNCQVAIVWGITGPLQQWLRVAIDTECSAR